MTYLVFLGLIAIIATIWFRITSSRILCLNLAMPLAIFAGSRGPYVGNDYTIYRDWYLGIGQESLAKSHFWLETIFFNAIKLSNYVNLPFWLFLILIAFIAVFIKLEVMSSFCQTRKAFIFSLVLYLSAFYLLHEFTQIRVGIALSFILLAIRQLTRGSTKHFYFWVVIAAGFHASALIAIFYPFIYNLKSRKFDTFLVSTTILLVFLRLGGYGIFMLLEKTLPAVDPRIEVYLSLALSPEASQANAFSITSLLIFITGFATILIQSKHPVRISDSLFYGRILVLSIWPLLLFPEIHEIASRLFEFLSSIIILLPTSKNIVRHKTLESLFLSYSVVMIIIFLFRSDPLMHTYRTLWN
jgi:hypothetical protein